MKKLVIVIMAVLFLTGCGNSDDKKTEDTAVSTNTTTAEGYVFKAGDVSFVMNAQATQLIENMGEYKDYFESESCAFKGLDKEYTYAGFVLLTYPVDEVDYVSGIEIYDDSISTPEGVTIGSSVEEVVKAYGEVEDSSSACIYTKDKSKLTILIKNGSVSSIQYAAITE